MNPALEAAAQAVAAAANALALAGALNAGNITGAADAGHVGANVPAQEAIEDFVLVPAVPEPDDEVAEDPLAGLIMVMPPFGDSVLTIIGLLIIGLDMDSAKFVVSLAIATATPNTLANAVEDRPAIINLMDIFLTAPPMDAEVHPVYIAGLTLRFDLLIVF